MGCCRSEPVEDSVETRDCVSNQRIQRRERTYSFYIRDDSDFLKNYEEQVIAASNRAYVEDSEIY